MYESGYSLIHNIDVSKTAIEIVSKRSEDKKTLTCFILFVFLKVLFLDSVENVVLLGEQASDQYDAVIDKGTLDSLLCGEGSLENVKKALQGIYKFESLLE
jgi:hypothetical protein